MHKRWAIGLGIFMIVVATGLVSVSRTSRQFTIFHEIVTKPTPQGTPKPSSMMFVGDIMLSREVGEVIVQKGDWRWPFLQVADTLRSADLTFGNLETTVSTRGTRVGSIYSFRSDPRTLEGLTHAGFDVVSVANNHIWDYARQAFDDTLTHLASAGISYVGGGKNFNEAHGGVVKQVGEARVGFLAYTDLISKQVSATTTSSGVSYLDEEQMLADITAMRPQVDILVVSFHLGDEYQPQHNAKQERIYKKAVDVGADLVVGHHPHVTQEVEKYKNSYIAYSLGNFVFDQGFSKETMSSFMLKAIVTDKQITSVTTIPITISPDWQPFISDMR